MKNRKVITIILLLIISISLSLYTIKRIKMKKETQTTNKARVTFEQISKESPNESALAKIMGKPKEVTSQGDTTIYHYESNSPNTPNEVVYKNGKLLISKEVVTTKDNKNSSEITSKYGVANIVLYGPDADAGFYLYVYPDKGIAYIGNPVSGDLLEIWYFETTTIDNFKTQFGQDYNEELPIIYDSY